MENYSDGYSNLRPNLMAKYYKKILLKSQNYSKRSAVVCNSIAGQIFNAPTQE